jgi:Cu-processing system ATP-binding protein
VAAEIGGTRINGASVEILCGPDQKMAELRRITQLGEAVADVEITPPRLEDLYRHYAQEAGQ